jgi:FkbM family methyltransferase
VSRTDHRRRLSAPFRPRNYRALVGSLRTYASPVDGLRRYVLGSGSYPWAARLRTPLGPVVLTVPHPHDVRTVNEVFCRRDYGATAPRVVVDVGANIGVAAAYFLTRRPDAVVHCWEPVDRNLELLRANTAGFGDRCRIHEAALAPAAGTADFLVEPVGRYSGLADHLAAGPAHHTVRVTCDAVADALRAVVAEHGRIDLLKIDTEGSEDAIVAAIPADLHECIGLVVHERPGGVVRTRGTDLGSGPGG